MEPFTFNNPTRFVFGPDAEQHAGDQIASLGVKKVLIIFGQGSVLRSGLLDRIKLTLDEAGIQHWQLGGVLPNPLSGPVYEGIEMVKREGVEALMGVGGGSAIDTAKAIALGALYEGDFWDMFAGKQAPNTALPVYCVPTISASGSESSNSAVITNEKLNMKRGVRSQLNRPQLALMNPALTFGVPSIQKAYGVADMMSHILSATSPTPGR
jgi:alcohol dehydrogenase YqhD (iron-dependent ADH family)